MKTSTNTFLELSCIKTEKHLASMISCFKALSLYSALKFRFRNLVIYQIYLNFWKFRMSAISSLDFFRVEILYYMWKIIIGISQIIKYIFDSIDIKMFAFGCAWNFRWNKTVPTILNCRDSRGDVTSANSGCTHAIPP